MRVPGTRAVCVREFQVTLEQSVMRLLRDKIEEFGLESKFRILNTHIETPGDGTIIFKGMNDQTAASIKSLEGFDIAWVEEAQTFTEASMKMLRPTIRKETCRYCLKVGPAHNLVGVPCVSNKEHLLDPSEIWFSWNPRSATDPVDQFLRGTNVPPDAIVVGSTYLDNPYLPDVMLREAEYDKERDFENYEHVWLGGYEKHGQARVFKNFQEREFETPDDVSLYYGADWGFSVDPSVLIRCWFKPGKAPAKGQLFVDYEAYMVGCEIEDLPELFDTVPGARSWPIVADSARPETISHMKNHGFPRMEPARKGPNSVKEGVIFLQGYDIVVHPRCTNTLRELKRYSFKTRKVHLDGVITDEVTPILADKENHVIDSLRYAVERLRKPKEWFVG